MSIRIAIAGAAGRMGQALVRVALQRKDVTISGAVARPGAPTLGQDVAALAGLPPCGVTMTSDLRAAASKADVWIDFSTPDATRGMVEMLPGTDVRAAIIGSTGLDSGALAAIERAAGKLAIVRSGNFSLGLNVLAGLVRQATKRLGPDWDIEIVEQHHRRKVDAPSGTALMLGEAAAAGRGKTLHDLRIEPRDGIVGARPDGGIGIVSVRAGGIVGDHEVILASESESLRFGHRATDRSIFADGAVHAAIWASRQKPGLYSMQDVLGL